MTRLSIALCILIRAYAQGQSIHRLTIIPDQAGTIVGELRLRETQPNGVNFFTVKGSAAMAANRVLTLSADAIEPGIDHDYDLGSYSKAFDAIFGYAWRAKAVTTPSVIGGNVGLEGGNAAQNYIYLQAADSMAGSYILKFPAVAPTVNQSLVVDPADAQKFIWTTVGAGSSPPFVDTTELIKGSVTDTKRLKIEVDGLTAATTRTWTAQDLDLIVAGINVAQTWTANQTLSGANLLTSAANTGTIGTAATPFQIYYGDFASTANLRVVSPASGHGSYWLHNVPTTSEYRIWSGAGTQVEVLMQVISTTQSDMGIRGSVYPLSTAGLNGDLGFSGTRWRKLWVTDIDLSGSCTGCPGGSSPPFTDTTALVKGSVDATKLLRFEVDGFTAATTRVLTPQDSDYTIAGINIAQTFSGANTFSGTNTFTINQNWNNDTGISFKDTGGTARAMLWMDGSNNFHVGPQAAPASNGDLSLYARGVARIKLQAGGTVTFEPITDFGVWLGTGSKRYAEIHAVGLTLYDNGAADAAVILQTQDAGSFVNLKAATSTGATYHLRFPASAPAAADKTLRTGSGTDNGTSWSTPGWIDIAQTWSSSQTFNGGIVTGSSTNSTIYIGTGSLYLRAFSGADASCSGITDGWAGIRTDTNELQVCIGSATKKVTLN